MKKKNAIKVALFTVWGIAMTYGIIAISQMRVLC